MKASRHKQPAKEEQRVKGDMTLWEVLGKGVAFVIIYYIILWAGLNVFGHIIGLDTGEKHLPTQRERMKR